MSPGALEGTNILWDVGFLSEQTPVVKAQITLVSVSQKSPPHCWLIWAALTCIAHFVNNCKQLIAIQVDGWVGGINNSAR